MKNNLYIDVHVIQTVPPSNLNRDDTGSPKTAQYGGVTRARVSSQSLKKAIRDYFKQNADKNEFGIRSKNFVDYVATEITKLNNAVSNDEALKLAKQTINNAGITTDAKSGKETLKALFFISPLQLKNLAQAALNNIEDKKKLQEILRKNSTIDIALFGRMLADDPTLNEDASSQVAHAISTHAVQTEFDFFTATDDLAPENNAGAGMLGTIEFNSSTLYRYANVAGHELKNQLGDEFAAAEAIKLFVESFVKSMPTGKINTFANQTLPQAIIVTVRNDRPVNLVTAFESPVKANFGYVEGSIKKLEQEYKNVLKYVEEPEFTLTLGFEGLGEEQESLKVLLNEFETRVLNLLQ